MVPARQLNPQMTAYQRMLKFGSADPLKLTKNTLGSVAVDICKTNRSNPWHNDKPNVNFQRDLNLMIEADREHLENPTLSRLCAMVADLIHRWERLTHERGELKWFHPFPRVSRLQSRAAQARHIPHDGSSGLRQDRLMGR